ncbi:HAMP domain-containing histidine kinase [Streptomyces sp. LX-29]|uniref:sensor histidine kinase n=1 Tax=Streptomyces sp. LX-29 TaxID=2900152 RepID=UPI00240E59FC|nr:HAMP domain-containing sensor histidine kinase [Streptomyces sp. LX-29]WFB08994.1 HAMP domain-containing histidine kinase [Streptomyces sp. LX-29]
MRRPARAGPHSLRVRLTLSNIGVLALGLAIAAWVSVLGIRHYMISIIDEDLIGSRTGLERAGVGDADLATVAALAEVGDEIIPSRRARTLFVVLDAEGRVRPFTGVPVDRAQRALAAAVTDPAALTRRREPADARVAGAPYRVTALRAEGGRLVLMGTSTEAVRDTVRKVVRLELAAGAALITLLGTATFIGARRRLRPLEDMVETASAIAEGSPDGAPDGLNLSRRVASRGRGGGAEVEQLRTALNAMLQQVEAAFVTREHAAAHLRRFVADASHELRTPLAAIRGYLQLYEKGMLGDGAERSRALARMGAETERMARLVDELLALARLDQRPRLRPRPVDLATAVRGAVCDLRAQQPARPVTLVLPEGAGPVPVLADEPSLQQVVCNLLANVRVHTPVEAAVRVTVGHVGDRVLLRVADAGPGMRPEDADRVFDRFFRGGTAEGSGLGMAVVRAAVEAQGGTVEVRTAPGAGLTATVLLPRAAAGPDEAGAGGAGAGGAGAGGAAERAGGADTGAGAGAAEAPGPGTDASGAGGAAAGGAGAAGRPGLGAG